MQFGGERHGQRRRDGVGQMIAGDARQVEHLGATRLRRVGSVGRRTRSRRRDFADQREHQVAAGIDVVRHDQQFAKARLAEVVGQQLGVAACRGRSLAAASAAPRREPDPTPRAQH